MKATVCTLEQERAALQAEVMTPKSAAGTKSPPVPSRVMPSGEKI